MQWNGGYFRKLRSILFANTINTHEGGTREGVSSPAPASAVNQYAGL